MISPPLPPSSPPSPSPPIFDRDDFMQRTLNDLKISHEVVALFVQLSPEYLQDVHAAATAGEVSALRKSAHKLKGAAANLSLFQLYDIASKIEVLANEGSIRKAFELLPKLTDTYNQAIRALEEEVGLSSSS